MQRWEFMPNMPITPALLVATFLLLWACWLWSRRKFYTLHAKLPGPLGLPLLGIGLQLKNSDKLLQYFEKISNEHKPPFVTWLGTSCMLYINDPETAETILQSPHCTDKGTLYRFIASTIGDGLFTSSSPRWNKHRRLLNPAFGRRVIETFFTVFNEETNVLVNKFATSYSESGELFETIKKCVLEISCQLLQFFEKISNEHKPPFVTWLGTSCMLYINDPETAETILQSPHCTDKGTLYRFISSTIGDGLFTSSSPRWNKHRRLLNPAFGRRVIETFFSVFNEETNVLVNKFATSYSESGELFETIKKCVLEISCQTTMGHKMNFQTDGSAEILNSYTGFLDDIIKRMLSPWLHIDVLYRYSATKKRMDQYIGIVNKFIESLLEDKKTTAIAPTSGSISVDTSEDYIEDEGITKSKSKIFIEYLRNHIRQGKLTIEDVRDEANVVVAASFDTISTTIYFVCLCLALHPEYQDKLYNELIDLFPNDNDGKELNLSEVTKDHLEHMTYTEMVINEAMRLFAPVPVVLRNTSNDFNLRDGTVVPQGTQIAIDIFNMQRSEQVWGPYARSFDPERHFGATNQEQHPFAFIPFTKGLRMCIGNLYALQLMKVVVAKIFLNFRVTTNAKMTDLVLKGTISLKLTHYPPCKFQPRFCITPEN